MPFDDSHLLSLFSKLPEVQKGLHAEHAIERETLRVTSEGTLSRSPHPISLGSALSSPLITTDFSEAQLELVTPIFKKESSTLNYLKQLHCFVQNNIGDESLWPSSAPCHLPLESEIPIAKYGNSNEGMKRWLYRQGLSVRYGSKMQTLSGIHYNFSLNSSVLKALYEQSKCGLSFVDFRSTLYLGLLRNFLKTGWILSYLFGSSPAFHSSFFNEPPQELSRLGSSCWVGEFATSLRMTDVGYYSKVQKQCPISFNSLDEYLTDLESAISTPHPEFTALDQNQEHPIQINDHILQIEAEHYARMRPKPPQTPGLSTLKALKNSGILYLENRALDLNPFSAEGISKEEIQFSHLYHLWCLFQPSPPLSNEDRAILTENQRKVSYEGRNPELRIQKEKSEFIRCKDWMVEIIESMIPIARMLGPQYLQILQKQKKKIHNPSLTPSAKILSGIRSAQNDFLQFHLNLAEKHALTLQRVSLSDRKKDFFEGIASKSILEQKKHEAQDDFSLPGFEDLEISTQMIIREAQQRGVTVEVLDRSENFIRLSKNGKTEYVKQATFTSKDSLISYFLMNNKVITKKILSEHSLSTPLGKTYTSLEEAFEDAPSFKEKKVAVKPNFTNFGLGISFLKAKRTDSYREALNNAFKHNGEVIVEEFIEGTEYRFLTIDGSFFAACKRIPANVIGDGIHTIRQLVKEKNENPLNYKVPKYRIRLGKEEKQHLQDQGLNPSSIPSNGEQIFLRTNTNVSTGGDPIDVTEWIHPSYRKIAEAASKSVDAVFCGLDMIIQDIETPADPNNYSIIELNFNPAIFLHRYPVLGQPSHPEKTVLDLLGFSS